ncbi:hypothetical protein AAFF_G00074570 [Aldrovandia affinis]|uniref:SH3-containing GRB2-like protein 3-interacting protein 1 n=1 Tax=Aldrovandia affinis TaxID=143900 RepID=A0AAD7WE38_9TELE|nr:hypothetical protein AAFF_G00074570 [Aldrovandia affinis]
MAEELCTGWFRIVAGSLEIEECKSAIMMEGLKKRTRKAFGIRKKEKDNDSTGSPDRDGSSQKKTNGAPNGFYGEIDWERYNSPDVDDEGYSFRPEEEDGDILSSWGTVAQGALWDSVGIFGCGPDEKKYIQRGDCKAQALNAHSTPTPTPAPDPPSRTTPVTEDATALFGPPLETAFEAHKTEVVIDEPEVWGVPVSETHPDSALTRAFPTRTPPPLPPKNVPATPPPCGSPSADSSAVPRDDDSDEQPAPVPQDGPSEGGRRASIADLDNIFGPAPCLRPGDEAAESRWVSFSNSPPCSPPRTPREEVPDSPASPPPPTETPTRTIPPPLVLSEGDRRGPEAPVLREDPAESTASPKEFTQGARATPPPPPPPTYRAVVSSPGPCSGTGSGSSSPARPATPLSGSSPTPPPPPPRPPSRPKLPPGKPGVGDVARPFSPPIHSSSPPPIAPLARAESTSSISSTNSLSAATTPTVGKELSVSVSENDQPSLVWFDRGKFYLTFEGCSRGPSPLTMGAQDTLPVAAAFTETVNAYFKGADPSKCVVKITGEMVLSFPAGITRHFANNPSPAILTFSITNYSRLEHVLPNPQLLCCDNTQSNANSKEFWVNMPNLMIHLKKVAEQKPQATYYNVDMLKYQVSAQGIQSTPLNLAVSWRCEPTSTDLRIDYKYNGEAMTTPMALHNVQFLVPMDGGVTKLQAVLPPAAWNAEQQRILWKIPDISQRSENGGVGSLLARFQLTEGPSKPSALALQFTSEGSTLSGCDIQLVGGGYRFSLIKKRFAAGKYMADN